MRSSAGSNAGARGAATARVTDAAQDHQPHTGLLEGELLDLYGAILIVVPVALFLKSLWM
jgi:hypothetical protein